MIVGWGWVRLESEDVEQEEAGRHHEHGGEGGRGGRADHQHLPDPGQRSCIYQRNLCTGCLQKSDFQNACLIFVICFTRAKFLENKIYTKKTRKLRQNTQ